MEKLNYSQKIQSIRAIAALWIFVFHYYHFIAHGFFEVLDTINPLPLLIYHGYFCVYVFFILSGFLLIRAYPQQLSLKSFIFKRLLKIFPALYLCFVVYYLGFTDSFPWYLWKAVFNTDTQIYPNTLGHLWFINRLLECYLCFPLLWWLYKKTAWQILAVCWFVIVLVGSYWAGQLKPSLPIYYGSFLLCLSHFIFGMLIEAKTIKLPSSALLGMVVLFFVSLMAWQYSSWQTPLAFSWLGLLWFNSLAVFIAVFIRAFLSIAVSFPRIITNLLVKLGKLSYEFYLYHFLVIRLFIEHKNWLTDYALLNFSILLLLSIFSAVIFQKLLIILLLIFRNGTLFVPSNFQKSSND